MNNKAIVDALNKEALFTCEILCSGVTQIRNGNYAQRGIYFQAFTSLSTGLERIGKLCLILNYFLSHNGMFPDNHYMKSNIRHDINKIYEELLLFKKSENITFNFLQDLDSDIHKNIIDILSKFAKGDRYSNIDLIVNNRTYEDPIKTWFEKVDLYIFNNSISNRKKEVIKNNARLVNELISEFSLVRHVSEDEKEINQIEDASFRTGVFEAVAPYRQLYTFQIIRFFVEMLTGLQYQIIRTSNFEVPYFSEIFRIFYNDDKYIKSRKAWYPV